MKIDLSSVTKKESTHPDLMKNFHKAKNWMQSQVMNYPFRTWLGSSEGGHNDILYLGFQPPRDLPVGNYAHPIPLKQASHEFESELDKTHKFYMKMLQSYNEKYKGAST